MTTRNVVSRPVSINIVYCVPRIHACVVIVHTFWFLVQSLVIHIRVLTESACLRVPIRTTNTASQLQPSMTQDCSLSLPLSKCAYRILRFGSVFYAFRHWSISVDLNVRTTVTLLVHLVQPPWFHTGCHDRASAFRCLFPGRSWQSQWYSYETFCILPFEIFKPLKPLTNDLFRSRTWVIRLL